MGETANGSLNTPARCLVRLVRHSVATPWPAYIKVVAVKPLFSRHAASARRSEGEICTRSTRDKVVKWHIGENSIGRFFGGGRSTRSTRHRTPGGPGVLWRVERPARNAGTTGQDVGFSLNGNDRPGRCRGLAPFRWIYTHAELS